MKVSIDTSGFQAVAEAIQDASATIKQAAARGLQDGMDLVVADATPLIHSVTGKLAGSFQTVAEPTESGAKGRVFNETEYALYVEMGTGARGAASDGGGTKSPTDGREYNLDHPGMAARPYLYPAFKANQDNITACVTAAIEEALGE